MRFVYPDRASEVTTSTGDQGDIILQGPEPSCWPFAGQMAIGDETTVCREDGLTSELVRVRLVAPDRLRYLAVYASSNGGARVVWPAGQQRVYATQLGRYALLPPDAGQAGRPVVVQPDGTYGAGVLDVPAPTGLALGTLLDAASAGGRSDGAAVIRLVVTWAAVPGLDYELEIREGLTDGWPGSASGGAVIPAGGGRFVAAVIGGYTYGVRLRARAIGGVSAWTPEQTIAATGDDVPPGPPTDIVVTEVYGGAVFTFTPPPDADTLEVRFYAAPTDDETAAVLVGAGLHRVALTGLPAGTTRWVWAASVDTSGNECAWIALGPVTALLIEPGDLAAELGERIDRLAEIDTDALDRAGEAALEAVLSAHATGQSALARATARAEAIGQELTGTINVLIEQTGADVAERLTTIGTRLDTVVADVDARLGDLAGGLDTRMDGLDTQIAAALDRLGDAETAITTEATQRATADESLASQVSQVAAQAGANAAAIVAEETARATADGALGQRIDAVIAVTEDNAAAITAEATARTDADSALGQRIDTVFARVGAADAAVIAEATARADADGALSTRIDTVSARAESAVGAVQSEAAARATADEALGTRIDTVLAATGANAAAILSEQTARADADQALSATIDVVAARVTGAEAAISTEQTARADADGALGQRIDTVAARADDALAAVQTEATARANADGALASSIAAVVADVAGNTAAITTEANARATADGALGQRIDSVVARVDGADAAITAEAAARAGADGALSTRIETVAARYAGGTNLVANLNRWPTLVWPAIADASVTCGYVMPLSGQWAASHSPWMSHLRLHTDYCLSFKARLTSGGGAWLYSDLYPDTLPESGFSITSGAWQTFSTVWRPTAADIGYCTLRFFLATAGVAIEITDVQLEEGNSPSAWSASPIEVLAAIREERTTRASAVEAVAQSVTTLAAKTTGDIAAAVQEERAARTTALEAVAGDIATVAANLGTANAAITAEQAARATADGALGQRIDGVAANVGDVSAAITAEATARAAADGALSTRIDTVSARTEEAVGAVQTEATARATADGALGQRIDTVAARSTSLFNALRRWDFGTNTEGWGVAYATMQWLSAGNVRISATGNDPMFFVGALSLDVGAAPLVCASITRRGGGSWDGALYFTTAHHGEGPFAAGAPNPNLSVGETAVVVWSCGAVPGTDWGSAAVHSIRLDLGNSAADVFDVHWVAVGNAAPGASTAALLSEQQARTDADGALGQRIDSVVATAAGNTAAIQSEATARANADSALGTRIDTLAARYTGGTNLVPPLNAWSVWTGQAPTEDATLVGGYRVRLAGPWQGTSSPALTVLRVGATYCLSFKARLVQGPAATLITDLLPDTLPESHFWVASADWTSFTAVWVPTHPDATNCTLRLFMPPSDGTVIDVADVQLEEGNAPSAWSASPMAVLAAIREERTARASADAALGQRIDTVTASIGDVSAAVQTETTARTTAVTALSGQITTVQTTVDGHTATIQQQAQSIGGLSAQWALKLNAGGRVVGIGAAASADVSELVFMADALKLVSTVNGTPVTPFSVVDGVAYFNSAMMGQAWIGDTHIGPTGLDAGLLRAGTVIAGTVKVGATPLSTVASQAATGAQDPAARINQGSTTLDPGKVVVKGTRTLTNVGGWFYGDTTEIDGGKVAAETITSREVKTGSLTVDRFAVFSTGNMLANSGFEDHWACWDRAGHVSGAAARSFAVNQPDANWYIAGGVTLAIHQPNATTGGYWEGYYRHPASGWGYLPVQPGQSYEWSLYTGAHRCHVQVYIRWRDVNGVELSYEAPEDELSWNRAQVPGGRTLSAYKRLWVKGAAPGNAAFAEPVIRKFDTLPGQGDSWGFFALPFFGACAPNATGPQPWQPGGVTKITGGQIAADDIIIRHSAQLGAATVTSLKIGVEEVTVPAADYVPGTTELWTGGWVECAAASIPSYGRPIIINCSAMQVIGGAHTYSSASYPLFAFLIQRGSINAAGTGWDWVSLLPELGGTAASGDVTGGVTANGMSQPWNFTIVDRTPLDGPARNDGTTVWRAYRFLAKKHMEADGRTASVCYRSISIMEARR